MYYISYGKLIVKGDIFTKEVTYVETTEVNLSQSLVDLTYDSSCVVLGNLLFKYVHLYVGTYICFEIK